MGTPAIRVDRVWKKFHRGEVHDSLRDMIPAMIRRLAGQLPSASHLGAGDFWALSDVAFEVQPGEALGVIGPNGAGKSTLLKILSRILRPNLGRYHVHGRLRALIEIAAGFHIDLTGRENIFLNGAILGMGRDQIRRRLDEIIAFADIESAIDTPVKRYSSGMVARLGFAIAAHMDPEVLLVDEVLSVGDVGFQTKCLAHMKRIRASGTAMIFVSHDIPQVMQLCDRLLVLSQGKVAHDGDRETGAQKYFDLATGHANYSGSNIEDMGRVRIRLANTLGQPVTRLHFGEPITLRCDTDFPEIVPNTDLLIRIESAEGQPLLALQSSRGSIGLAQGPKTLLCRLPNVRLLPGTYKTTAHVRDRSTGRVLDHFLNQQPITIAPPADVIDLPASGTAYVDVPQAWEDISPSP